MRYILGNFKANKTRSEMQAWVNEFTKAYKPHPQVTVGLFPQMAHLDYLSASLSHLQNVFVGSQTISSYAKGSYTGEVTAQALSGLISYSIIGHSERRKFFGETDDVLFDKVTHAKQNGIEPIYCIRNDQDPIPDGVVYVAYEPVAAIGTGQNEPPEATCAMKQKMKLPPHSIFIYGGSVNASNARDYFKTNEIDGFLIGKVTLDPQEFLAVVNVARSH